MATTTKRALPSSGPISFSEINYALRSSSNTVSLSLSNTALRSSLFKDSLGSISLSTGYNQFLPYGGLVDTWESTGTHSTSFTSGTLNWGDDVDNRRVIIVSQIEDDSQSIRGQTTNIVFRNNGDSGDTASSKPIVYNDEDTGSSDGITAVTAAWGRPESNTGTVFVQTDDPRGGSPSWNYKHISVYAIYGLPDRTDSNFYREIQETQKNGDFGSTTSKSLNFDGNDKTDNIYLLLAGIQDNSATANITFEGTTYGSGDLDVYRRAGDGTMYSLGVILWDVPPTASMTATVTTSDSTDIMFAGAVLNYNPAVNDGVKNFPSQYFPPPPPPYPPSPPPEPEEG